MQADSIEDRVPSKPEEGLPTPPPTPKKLLPNGKAAFPLFDSLIREGFDHQNKNSPLTVPATAPVLTNTEPHLTRNTRDPSTANNRSFGFTKGDLSEASFWFSDMGDRQKRTLLVDQEYSQSEAPVNADENIQPIKLQDPPKPKLKRQLSINTVEQTEKERTPKKTFVPKETPFTTRSSSEQTWTPYIDPKRDEVDGRPGSSTDAGTANVDKMPTGTSYPGPIPTKAHTRTEPMQSPHYFNLKDIELTSPFLNPNLRRKSKENDDHVFVFPETVDERRSPTKQSPAKKDEHTYHGTMPSRCTQQEEFVQHLGIQSFEQEQRTSNVHRVDTEDNPQRKTSQIQVRPAIPTYVTHEGFKWPVAATISEAPPFSPRLVTAYPKSTYQQQVSNDQPTTQNEEIAKLQERIKLLEKEYERAKAIYRPDNSYSSPRTRDIQEILRRSALRSISDIERSPNEKEIRRLEAEVKNKYERSISDPTFSPRHRMQRFVQQPSPLGRQNSVIADAPQLGMNSQTSTNLHGLDRWQDPWNSDVRRQLFSREEYKSEYDPLPTPNPESVFLEDVQLPDEVAKFFHSKSFHPEDLENLRGILKRSQEYNSPQQQTSSHLDDRCMPPSVAVPSHIPHRSASPTTTSPEGLQRPLPSEPRRYTDAHRSLYAMFEDMRHCFASYPLMNPPSSGNRLAGGQLDRGRKTGDIDVKITCENITEKVKQAKEILKDLEHSSDTCHCARIEQEILAMTNEAFARIRRMDASEESFLRFSQELNEANTSVYKSLEILCGIKCMCKYGRTLEEIYSGSIVFKMNCPNAYALDDLWESYKSGDLERLITNMFVTKDFKDKFNAADIKLKVSISWEAYKQCKHELEMAESGIFSSPSPVRGLFNQPSPAGSPIIHCRSRSEPIVNSSTGHVTYRPTMSPFRERICSDSTVELSPRRAFQEINVGRDTTRLSLSPSKRSLLEGIFADFDPKRSPNMSPRRKSFGIKSPLEHENRHPEDQSTNGSPVLRLSDV